MKLDSSKPIVLKLKLNMDNRKILIDRLKGFSVEDIAESQGRSVTDVDAAIKAMVEATRAESTISANDSKSIELARLDRWTVKLETTLEDNCTDPREINQTIKTLLDILKIRSSLLQLNQIEDDHKNEAAKLFDEVREMDIETASVEEMIRTTLKLHQL